MGRSVDGMMEECDMMEECKKCKKCGRMPVEEALTSLPPQYRLECPGCGRGTDACKDLKGAVDAWNLMNGGIPSQINGRDMIFGAVTGSYNYNLNEAGSDKDWHFLVLPSFEDVYTGRLYTNAQVTSILDYTAWDIRRFSELLWKSNPNVLEMLFSVEGYFPDSEFEDEMRLIFIMKDKLAKMNLPYLYKAGMGIVHNEIKYLDKKNPDLLQEFGYSTKAAMHAYRSLLTLKEFGESGFTDFGGALHCDKDKREMLLAIKHGETFKDMDDARCQLSNFMDQVSKDWEHAYLSAEPDISTRNALEHVCKSMFRRSLRRL